MCNINDDRIYVELESQNKICKKIINIVKSAVKSVSDNELDRRLTVINLVGEEGSGKTTICRKLLAALSDWSAHYVLCDETELAGSGIRTGKRRESFPVPSFSIHIGILTLGLSQRFQEADSIFNDIEKQFIKEIKSDYGKSLIFVENLDRADELTQKFVRTICNVNNVDRFYRDFPIVFIITSNSKMSDLWTEIHIENLNEEEIISLGMAFNRNDIRSHAAKLVNLTDGNIDFVLNLLKSKEDADANTISSIIDKRLSDICKALHIDADADIEDICICGTYFENGFTVKQINKIFPAYTEEFILKLFLELDKKKLLKNDMAIYKYSVEQFKNGLQKRRANYAALYFARMYSFYTNYYDEKYLDRLKFALLLQSCGVTEDLSDKTEALLFKYMTTLIYGRRITDAEDLQKFLKNYSAVQLDKQLLQLLGQLAENDLHRENLYPNSYVQYDKLVQAEISIIELNYLSRMNTRTNDINNALIYAINIADQLEAEKQEYFALLHLRLAIVNVLLNRSTLSQLRKNQIEKLNRILYFYRNRNTAIYLEYMMRQNRKSAICYPCDRSIRDVQDAAEYFAEKNNVYEQYYSYVNLIGLFAITMRYDTDEYENTVNHLNQLIAANGTVMFYKPEKLEHNLLLNGFFKESRKCGNPDEYMAVAEKYYIFYSDLYKKCKFKTTRLNMVSLRCLFGISDAQKELDRFLQDNAAEQNFDEFYDFYLNDLKCMILIVSKEWVKAKQILNHITTIHPSTFNNCQIHLTKRIEAFHKIIDNQIVCNDICEYDNLIYRIFAEGQYGLTYFYGVDESWQFYSKGFLLTDTQYFS